MKRGLAWKTLLLQSRDREGAVQRPPLPHGRGSPIGLVLLFLAVSAAHAHPVPKGTHDRTITVRLARDHVLIDYRLEVDEWTAIFEDLPAVEKQIDLARLSQPGEFYEAFTRATGPLLAGTLKATAGDRSLAFTCVRSGFEVKDSLQCAFLFRADWQPGPDGTTSFTFRDETYRDAEGRPRPGSVRVTLAEEHPGLAVAVEPALPGAEEAERVRTLTARVEVREAEEGDSAGTTERAAETGDVPGGKQDLVHLFLNSRHGLWALLLLAAGLGAAHALTPGHGKTMVAAYLVGERGTTLHALVLGVVTTLTHTGVVLILALGLRLFFPHGMTADVRRDVQTALELFGGLLIAGLGLWLLLRRLTGRADHVHFGGGHAHHHHHGDHHHPHDHDHAHDHHHHDHEHHTPVGWWGLITLGISGGIVPCWDAVALLVAAVAMNLLWWALPLLLAFSAGLAAVLILIGLLVVHTRALAGSRWDKSRLFRALPLLSAMAVTGLGLWLCYSSLHAAPFP